MVILEPSFGLANRIRVIASGIRLGEQINEPIIVLWDKTYEINCDFSAIFQPIPNITILPKKRYHRYIKSSAQPSLVGKYSVFAVNKLLGIDFCAKIIDGLPFREGAVFDLVKMSKKHKNIYVKTCGEFGYGPTSFCLFKLTPELQKITDSRVSLYTNKTIGLHIRRTDHVDAIGNSPLSLFIDKIQAEIDADAGVNFYLSTDDPGTEKNLKEIFGNKIITYDKDFSRDTPQGIKDAVLDMFGLANTTKIYGSFNSSFSDVASRLGNIPLLILAT